MSEMVPTTGGGGSTGRNTWFAFLSCSAHPTSRRLELSGILDFGARVPPLATHDMER